MINTNKPIYYAFHIHTARCGHAAPDPAEAYVKTALELGLKSITFTDHTPFPGDQFCGRMKMAELNDYEKELRELQQKYAGRIKISVGLEVEWMPEFTSFYQELHDRFDLLILGQHHTSLPGGYYTFQPEVPKEYAYNRLIETIPQAMETGLFSVVAHPDRRFHYDNQWTKHDSEVRDEIFVAADYHHVLLERNGALLEDGRNHGKFWADLPEQVGLIYGLDAHSPEDIRRRLPLLQELKKKLEK